tara:strand:- start:190 stop:588 length:399 start_codon:yes stop_codon:yes gene_type:complete
MPDFVITQTMRQKEWVSEEFKNFCLRKGKLTKNKKFQDGINLTILANKRLRDAVKSGNIKNVVKIFSDDYAKCNYKTADMTPLVIKWNIDPQNYILDDVAVSANNFINKWMMNIGRKGYASDDTKALKHYRI